MRKGARESHHQTDLNYNFMCFLSERGVKPMCVKFIPLQTLARVGSKSMEYVLVQLPECGVRNYDYI